MSPGVGLRTGYATDSETPPTGSGLNTKTTADPPSKISVGKMLAVSCVGLTKVVSRPSPPKYTFEPGTKFEPFTVSVNPGPSAVTVAGENEVIEGTGLEAPVGANEIAIGNCNKLL